MLSSGNLNGTTETNVTAAGASRPLKVLHIDPERNWGGGEEQVLGLICHLSRKGHANHLATDGRGRLFESSRGLGITTVAIRVANDLDIRPVPGLRRLIRRERYDIVHFHTKRAHALALWLPKCRGAPRYLVTRRMDYAEPNNWYTHLLYNRRVDGVVAISRRIAQLLAEAGVEQSRIRLIHSGIDLRRHQNGPRAPASFTNSPVIGMAAVLEQRKGHRYLLQAASSLKKHGFRLKYRIAGDGSLRRDLHQLTATLGLQEDVEFLGFVSDMSRFFSTIDIFVLPSLSEGLGLTVLEAMAAGKPVVASRVGGVVDAVIDSMTGFLIAPKDVDGIAVAIRKLVQDQTLAEAMGKRGAERVRENFTIEQMAEKNEAYYYALLGNTIPCPE
jgi:glycosyltransferase involved in cell wall biosynthesis